MSTFDRVRPTVLLCEARAPKDAFQREQDDPAETDPVELDLDALEPQEGVRTPAARDSCWDEPSGLADRACPDTAIVRIVTVR